MPKAIVAIEGALCKETNLWLSVPISVLPTWLQPIAKAFPLAPINTILRDIVYGVPVEDLWRLGVLAGWVVLAIIITVRFFRWE